MRNTESVYHNLGYWFLTFIVLVAAGFYYSYFTVLFEPRPLMIHIHFVLMALWVMMLITQPFLIKYHKRSLHRLIGRISYVLVPLLLLTAFIVIRGEYYRNVATLQQEVMQGLKNYTVAEITRKAGEGAIGIFYFFWFVLFYTLAIVNRKKSSLHARYMLATSLTLLGPTVDRILGINFGIERIGGVISSYVISFLIADLILVLLIINDLRNKVPVRTLTTCLVIYVSGQLLYYTAPGSAWWGTFMAFILQPAP